MKLVKHLAGLGYGSRRETQLLLKAGAFKHVDGSRLTDGSQIAHEDIRFRGEPLDPPAPLTIMLHKPIGYTCSNEDPGAVIFDLLPPRFSKRNPALNSAGRLDKETSGLLILTDDGALAHRIIHPKSACKKTYRVILDRPLSGDEPALFAAGELILRGETYALLPAQTEIVGPHEAIIRIQEGRYHQIRRMFAATGNHVNALQRTHLGSLALPSDLPAGAWRTLGAQEINQLFALP